MVTHEDFWLNEVVFTDLSLIALWGMLLEYATDCHKWGENDEAYKAMALATKMFGKHENMVLGPQWHAFASTDLAPLLGSQNANLRSMSR